MATYRETRVENFEPNHRHYENARIRGDGRCWRIELIEYADGPHNPINTNTFPTIYRSYEQASVAFDELMRGYLLVALGGEATEEN